MKQNPFLRLFHFSLSVCPLPKPQNSVLSIHLTTTFTKTHTIPHPLAAFKLFSFLMLLKLQENPMSRSIKSIYLKQDFIVKHPIVYKFVSSLKDSSVLALQIWTSRQDIKSWHISWRLTHFLELSVCVCNSGWGIADQQYLCTRLEWKESCHALKIRESCSPSM